MAIVLTPTRVDDLNEEPGASFRTFAVGTTQYGIDLTDKNYRRLLRVLEPFISNARVLGQLVEPSEESPAPAADGAHPREMPYGPKPTQSQLRLWAKSVGLDVVPDAGRLNSAIGVAYQACRKHDDGPLEDLRQNIKFSTMHAAEDPRTEERPPGGTTLTAVTRSSGQSGDIASAS